MNLTLRHSGKGLGYQLIHFCAVAQVRLEYRARALGPPQDPHTKVQLTLILRTGTRAEQLKLDSVQEPVTTSLQDFAGVTGRRFGFAMPNIMTRIDPTFRERLLKYTRLHPLANP